MKMKMHMHMLLSEYTWGTKPGSSYPNFKEKKKERMSIKFARLKLQDKKIRAMGN